MKIKNSFVAIGRTIWVIAKITVHKSYGPILSLLAGISIGLLIASPNLEAFLPRLIITLIIWLIIVFHALYECFNHPDEVVKL